MSPTMAREDVRQVLRAVTALKSAVVELEERMEEEAEAVSYLARAMGEKIACMEDRIVERITAALLAGGRAGQNAGQEVDTDKEVNPGHVNTDQEVNPGHVNTDQVESHAEEDEGQAEDGGQEEEESAGHSDQDDSGSEATVMNDGERSELEDSASEGIPQLVEVMTALELAPADGSESGQQPDSPQEREIPTPPPIDDDSCGLLCSVDCVLENSTDQETASPNQTTNQPVACNTEGSKQPTLLPEEEEQASPVNYSQDVSGFSEEMARDEINEPNEVQLQEPTTKRLTVVDSSEISKQLTYEPQREIPTPPIEDSSQDITAGPSKPKKRKKKSSLRRERLHKKKLKAHDHALTVLKEKDQNVPNDHHLRDSPDDVPQLKSQSSSGKRMIDKEGKKEKKKNKKGGKNQRRVSFENNLQQIVSWAQKLSPVAASGKRMKTRSVTRVSSPGSSGKLTKVFQHKKVLAKKYSADCKETQKSYVCRECKRSFTRKSKLENHKRQHSGEGRHICECGKTFADKHNLARHQQLHTGVKPFKCDICNKDFARKYYVTDHQKRVH